MPTSCSTACAWAIIESRSWPLGMRSIISCLIFISRSALERSSERTLKKQRERKCFRLRRAGSFHISCDLTMLFSYYTSYLIQVVGQTAVEALHSLLLIGAVAVQSVQLEAHWSVEIMADGGWTGQRAGCSKRDGRPGPCTAGVHQRTTGKRGAVHWEASDRHARGHDGQLWEQRKWGQALVALITCFLFIWMFTEWKAGEPCAVHSKHCKKKWLSEG